MADKPSTTNPALKPCPFCGGAPEIDHFRGYRALVSGNVGTGVAIYCTSCSADMMLCKEDHPGLDIDDLANMLREQWNRHPESSVEAVIADLREPFHRRAAELRASIAELRQPQFGLLDDEEIITRRVQREQMEARLSDLQTLWDSTALAVRAAIAKAEGRSRAQEVE